jgi:hypothetical protein
MGDFIIHYELFNNHWRIVLISIASASALAQRGYSSSTFSG